MSLTTLCEIGNKVLNGGAVTFDEAIALTRIEENEIPIL